METKGKYHTAQSDKEGFLASDPCLFCGTHDSDKAHPYVCQACYDAALELARALGWQPKTVTTSTAGLTKLNVEHPPPGQWVEAALLRVAHGETTQDDALLLRAAIQCRCDDDCPLLEGWEWDDTSGQPETIITRQWCDGAG